MNNYGIPPTAATGRHLYTKLSPERYPCYRQQSPETHYVKGFDRGELPDHSSRFGYARCANGYCLGHFPGRYVNPPGCDKDVLPPGNAPERFYNDYYTNPYTVASQAIVDYNNYKNGGCLEY